MASTTEQLPQIRLSSGNTIETDIKHLRAYLAKTRRNWRGTEDEFCSWAHGVMQGALRNMAESAYVDWE